MDTRKLRVLALGCILVVVACRSTRAIILPQVESARNVDTLGQGDVIQVSVFREHELDGVFRVGAEGDIHFPLIGRVEVLGKRPEQVATDISSRLDGDYLRAPQVTVLVREQNSRKVHVFGQVGKAGTFSYQSGMTVIEAITNAGGFGELAAPNRTRVTRVISGSERVFELAAGDIGEGRAPNFPLKPGDIVFVPEAIF
ncbi:MAG: polysaccharide export protein [Myxococcales bacterium]|nr:polysaccharide export protein [Myxococcales bacterium]